MALTGVLRPGHVQIRVLELEPAVKHYRDVLGLLEVARDKRRKLVFLKAWDEQDHHSVVLREADEAGMDYMGWKVDSPATLKKLAKDIEASGLCQDLEWIPAGEHPETGERFRFTIPTGPVMELYAYRKVVGNGCVVAACVAVARFVPKAEAIASGASPVRLKLAADTLVAAREGNVRR